MLFTLPLTVISYRMLCDPQRWSNNSVLIIHRLSEQYRTYSDQEVLYANPI